MSETIALANLEGLDRRLFFSKILKTARGQMEICPFLFVAKLYFGTHQI
jgi:hypothetical protein